MWKRALHFHYMYCAAQHHQITSVSKINLLIKISPNQKFIIFVNVSNLLLALNGYYNPYWNILTCELKLLWSIIVLSFLFERNQHHVMNVCQRLDPEQKPAYTCYCHCKMLSKCTMCIFQKERRNNQWRVIVLAVRYLVEVLHLQVSVEYKEKHESG